MTQEIPKDAKGTLLNEGDSVETLVEIPISATAIKIPPGTKLGKIRWWYDNDKVEVDRVIIEGSELDLVIRTEFIKKVEAA